MRGGGTTGLARWIAAGFGSGWAPVAPGTFGSLLAVILGLPLLAAPLPAVWLLAAAALATAAGLWAIGRGSDGDDHGWIVIDEIAGQWIAMGALPRLGTLPLWQTGLGLLAAFLLFRAFDITKPGPIGWADRQHGAAGIMGDDLIAGVATALVLLAAETVWRMVG